MKKIMTLLVIILASASVIKAGNDKPIQFNQLPQKAQNFVTTHFPDVKVSFAKVETDFFEKSYEIIFVNSAKIEFDGNGDWKEIDCKYGFVPEAVIPEKILTYVKANFEEQKVVEIERKNRKYEVKLNSSIEIDFDLQFNVIDIDL